MMENAGRNLSDLATQMMTDDFKISELSNIIYEILNSQNPRILSLDAPLGLETTTGKFSDGFCINAYSTMTLALPKEGLIQKNAKECVGKLYIADISVPRNYIKILV